MISPSDNWEVQWAVQWAVLWLVQLAQRVAQLVVLWVPAVHSVQRLAQSLVICLEL